MLRWEPHKPGWKNLFKRPFSGPLKNNFYKLPLKAFSIFWAIFWWVVWRNLVTWRELRLQVQFYDEKRKWKTAPETFLLKTGTEVWYHRWLWDGIFCDPNSQIPGIWDFFSSQKSRRQSPEKSQIPGFGIFSRAKSQNPKKSRKFITKIKKTEFIIVVFLWGKTKNPKKSLYQENPTKSRKSGKKSVKSRRTSQEIAAKIDESETYFVPKSPKIPKKLKNPNKNWKIRFKFFTLFYFVDFIHFFFIFGIFWKSRGLCGIGIPEFLAKIPWDLKSPGLRLG